MKHNTYDVVLTNGTVKHTYRQYCNSEKEAIILSQAEAIKMGRVSIEEIKQ